MTENEKDYYESFGFKVKAVKGGYKLKLKEKGKKKAEKALEYALDTRKFEIEMYWKRATYFWALIAVAFAGYFGVLSTDAEAKYYSFIIACVGIVFSWAWLLVNKGSKYWQENWENHVSLLEDYLIGPLYKTRLERPLKSDSDEFWITRPKKVSVSKINQFVAWFTIFIWVILIFHSFKMPFNLTHHSEMVSYGFKHALPLGISVLICFLMKGSRAATYDDDHEHVMLKRTSKII